MASPHQFPAERAVSRAGESPSTWAGFWLVVGAVGTGLAVTREVPAWAGALAGGTFGLAVLWCVVRSAVLSAMRLAWVESRQVERAEGEAVDRAAGRG